MADEAQLSQALMNAHNAGDVEAARMLAGEIQRLRATAKPPAEPPKSALQEIGLGTRSVIQGLGSIPAFAYDAAALPGNAVRYGYNKITGNDGGYSPSGSELIKSGLDKVGLPEATTDREKLFSAFVEGGAAAMSGTGLGGALKSVAKPVVSAIGDALASSPLTQLFANGFGSAAGEKVRQEGGGTVAQLAAQLAVPVGVVGTSQLATNGVENIAQRLQGATTADRKIVAVIKQLGEGDLQKGLGIVNAKLKENPDQALVDVLGMKGQKMARAATNVEGDGADLSQAFIQDRQAGRLGRMQSAADRLAPNNFYEDLDALNQQKRVASKPLYDESFAPISDKAGNVYAQWDERLQQFLDDPIVEEGMSQGIRTQQLEALADGVKFNPNEYAVKGFDKNGQLIIEGTPNLRAMDAAKRGLDAKLNEYRNQITGKLELDERGWAIEKVRKALVAKLDEITTDAETGVSKYAQARSAWAGPSQLEDAMWQGRNFLRGDNEITAKVYHTLPESVKEAFKFGVRRELQDMLAKDTESAPGKFASKKADLWQRIESIFPPEDVSAFRGGTQAEATKQGVERFVNPRAGSQTGGLQQDIRALNTMPDAVGEAALSAVRQDPVGLARALMSPVNKLLGPSEKTAGDLARALFELDPKNQSVILDRFKQTPVFNGPGGGNVRALIAALEAKAAADYEAQPQRIGK